MSYVQSATATHTYPLLGAERFKLLEPEDVAIYRLVTDESMSLAGFVL